MLIDINSLHFLKKIKGIVHIGAHECEERISYLSKFNDITDDDIIWIEALENKVKEIKEKYPSIKIYNECISDTDNQIVNFNVTNNYQSSSILKLKDHLIKHQDIYQINTIQMKTKTLKTFYDENNFKYEQFNFLNLDIQGAELLALRGADTILYNVDFIYIEVNTEELYENTCLLDDIDNYLSKFDFVRTRIYMLCAGWGDAFYVKKKFNISENINVYYGTDLNKMDITNFVYNSNTTTNNIIHIPAGDDNRSALYGDPMFGQLKSIYIESNNELYTIEHNDNIYLNIKDNILGINYVPKKYENELSVMAIFKNETMNLKLWLDHYLWQGVEHFYLIDNDSDDNPMDILQEYIDKGIVSYFFRPEKHKQVEHYRDVFDSNNIKYNTKWLIICDLDEFFFGTEKILIHTLNEFNQHDIIYTNSFFYGCDDNINHPKDIRISNVYRNNDTVNGIKYIFKPNIINDSSEIWIHWLVERNTLFKKYFPTEIEDNEKIRLNHYQIQSLEYFQNIKITRGDVSRKDLDNMRDMKLFYEYNKICTIKDDILKNIIETNYNSNMNINGHDKVINTALIIESRFLKHLPFVINDFNKKLGPYWRVVFYCAKGLKHIWIDLLDEDIEIRELKYNYTTIGEYWDILKNKDLWTNLYGDYVLVFTPDSSIINKEPYTIDYFTNLNKSYIGANQSYTWRELMRENIYPKYNNFQGGLSLRKRLDMIKIIETFGSNKSFSECSLSQSMLTDAEDVYFTIGCYKLNLPVGDDEACSHFSCHTILKYDFFGANRLQDGYYFNLNYKYDNIGDNIYLIKNIEDIENEFLIIHEGGGFFSNCTVKLFDIILYFNATKKLPILIDSSRQLNLYKYGTNKHDITYEYFENIPDHDITYLNKIDFHEYNQYTNYRKLNINSLSPFIKKYFTPSENIKTHINNLELKYNIIYENICVLFLRGNDKITETCLPSYEKYIEQAKILYNENKNIQFLIQSDENEFIKRMQDEFPNNSFYFKDEIRTINKDISKAIGHEDKQRNFEYAKVYLAITLIMSKCKYIICSTGNCSLWIMLYRGNSNNIYQI